MMAIPVSPVMSLITIAAGMIGHGQRVAVVVIAQQELALVIRASQFIGTLAER